VICSQISIFEPLNTALDSSIDSNIALWFALKLVSLNHWIQPKGTGETFREVVICSQISIFEPLNTADGWFVRGEIELWFALKLVSLNHWIQLLTGFVKQTKVVICSQISIFEPLNTARSPFQAQEDQLWFALKLVSLNHWIQRGRRTVKGAKSCDLLSN